MFRIASAVFSLIDFLSSQPIHRIATFPSEEVKPGALFYTGSTTEAFIATAVSIFVNDNKNSSTVQWTTPINTLIRDDFVLTDEYWTNHITLEDVMSHRTGMPRHDSMWIIDDGSTVRRRTRSLRHLPLTNAPPTTSQYCNLMFMVVSHVIETATGQGLGDFLRIHIYELLNMTSTFFSLSDAQNSSDPKKRAFAIMGNTAETSNLVASVLGYYLVDQLLGAPEQERYDWNASNQDAVLVSQKPFNRTAIPQSFYPHLPSPHLLASLPLSSYANSYHHLAYGAVTLNCTCDKSSTALIRD
ncbi:beta-lactamase/transpeptidase-like protein [Cryomyces antarcticus]